MKGTAGMPCTMTGSIEGDRAWSAEVSAERAQAEITKLTQLLCSLCKTVEDDTCVDIPDEVEKWWRAHQEVDRKARLKRKAEILAKLTPEERAILSAEDE